MISKARQKFESIAAVSTFLMAIGLFMVIGSSSALAAEDSCPNAEIRAEQHSQRLPDCRAYEIASHYPTGGVPVIDQSVMADGETGDGFAFGAVLPLPTDNVMPFDTQRGYLSRRDEGSRGWSVDAVRFPMVSPYGIPSPDASAVVQSLKVGIDPDDQNLGTLGSDGMDVYLRKPSGEFVWLSRDRRVPVGQPQTTGGARVPRGTPTTASMSSDGSVVVFEAYDALLAEDTSPPPTGSDNRLRLYKWTDDGSPLGELQLIGKTSDGEIPNTGSALGATLASAGGQEEFILNSVSSDGSRVVLRAGEQTYVQIDGAPNNKLVAKATGVPPVADPEATYQGADRDIDRVWFTSRTRLTPDSGASTADAANDLYVDDVSEDAVRDLTPRLDGSNDPETDPLVEDRARVRGVAGFSEDGKRVFFVADGAFDTGLSPEGDLPDPSGNNLYMAELGAFDGPLEIKFITTLSNADAELAFGIWPARTAYSSPTGEVFGFGATTNLTGFDVEGTRQVFVYDAGEHTLECASCPTDGSSPMEVNTTMNGASMWQHPGGAAVGGQGRKRWVSTDGSVIFHTRLALTVDDKNAVEDTYVYRDGELYLISGGSTNQPSRFIGASTDGSTIWFGSADALTPADEEPGIQKIYAARVNGGFKSEQEPAAPCVGDDCRPPGGTPPVASDPGSQQYQGSGNPSALPIADCRQAERKRTRTAKKAKRLSRRARNASDKAKQRTRRKARKAKQAAKQAKRRAVACKRGASS